MTSSRRDADWMGVALGLARRGLGTTWPNPSVGCVIVKNGRILGRGRTQNGGRPHAETEALAQAGKDASGATAYVTLEPCSHTGKTPPCTEALIRAGIRRVVIAQNDPDTRVDGLRTLKKAGIEVETGICEAAARTINIGFTTRVMEKRPFVTLKIATTLDGKIATEAGESRWITGPLARRRVHMLRASHDAVMVGRGTAEADDPMLDVRDLGPLRNPVRIILDNQLKTSPDARMIKTSAQTPTWLVHGKGAVGQGMRSCKLIEVSGLNDAMEKLADEGLTRVLCEGGACLAASLLKADLVDVLIAFNAGKLIGAEGLSAIGPLDLTALPDAPQLDLVRTEIVGSDIMSVWQRKPYRQSQD